MAPISRTVLEVAAREIAADRYPDEWSRELYATGYVDGWHGDVLEVKLTLPPYALGVDHGRHDAQLEAVGKGLLQQ